MQIHSAAKRGDNLAVERQLRRGIDVDARDGEGKTPLIRAAEGRKAGVKTLELLLKNGADVNASCTTLDDTPLDMAARTGSLEKVQFLLAAGADPGFVNKSGYTAITNLPAYRDAGHMSVLETLLNAGADPNVITTYGECPLRAAINAGNFAAIPLLFRFGASREPAAMTELMWAIALGSLDDVRTEIRKAGDLAARNAWEMTPWLLSLLAGDIAKAELLLESGATLSETGRCGKTNLMYPLSCDDANMTEWLLSRGADVHATDDSGHTALTMAGSGTCARLLLDAGARIETPDGSPIIVEADNIETVRVLVEHGADIDTVGGDGYCLLKTAAESGDDEFARQLLLEGASPHVSSTGDTPLHAAAGHDNLDIVAMLLQHGADPNAVDVDGWTPLMFAGSLECVDLLLAAGADIHASDDVNADVAQHHRDPEILDRFKEAGASLLPKPDSYSSLLHAAAEDGDTGLLEYLLGQNADVNVHVLGITPLMKAAERGNVDVIKRLLSAGADVHARDEDGRTALFCSAAPEAFTAFQLTQELPSSDALYQAMGELADELKDAFEQYAPNYGYQPSDDVTGIDLLLSAGARLEDRDSDGATPLLVSCRCGRAARVARLVQQGANVRARDAAGRSAWDLPEEHHDAEQRNHILRLLDEVR